MQVASVSRDKWLEVGVYLGFQMKELNEYEEREPKSLKRRLLRLLVHWQKNEEHPTVGALVAACEKAGIGGKVKWVLQSAKD